MNRIVLLFLCALSLLDVVAQKKGQTFYKMPNKASYTKGRVLVKVKDGYKNEIISLSVNNGTKLKNISFQAVTPIVHPQLSKFGERKKGARSQKHDLSYS